MAMRPLQTRSDKPSFVVQVLTVCLTPAIYAASVFGWGYRQAIEALQLPITALVVCLKVADNVICDVVVFLTKEPGPKAQLGSFQETISSLQLSNKAQQRQILLLQNELDGVKLEKSKTQIRNMELSDKVKSLQQQLHRVEERAAAAAAAAAAIPAATAAAPFGTEHFPGGSSSYCPPSVMYDAKGWYLHACVVLAALGVRWWLVNQTDPLQRKFMLVIIWPIAWLYGAMLFNCLPRSSTLRSGMACCCWALLGYIAHEMVSFSVKERQQYASINGGLSSS